MDEDLQDELVAAHILFKPEDKFQKAAGLKRKWPEGRGFYMSKAETFKAWVNEEDHLQLFAMDKSGDITEAFRIVTEALEEVEKHLDFSYDDNLGYLTSCPTNIGTGMQASFQVYLPNMANDEAKTGQEIAHGRKL